MPDTAQPSVDIDTSVERKPPVFNLDPSSVNLHEPNMAINSLHLKSVSRYCFYLLVSLVIFLSLFICLCSYVAYINIYYTFTPKTANDQLYLKNTTNSENTTAFNYIGGKLVPRESREIADLRCITGFTKGAVQGFINSQEDAKMWLANCANVPAESKGPSSGDYEFWLLP